MAFKSVINGATANQAGAVTTGGDALILAAGVRDKAGGHFAVTQNGTPNMSVNVAAGDAMVARSTYAAGAGIQRFVPAFSDATTNVIITANGSGNPRIDLICIKIDPAASAGIQGVGAVSIVAVAGTPAGSPVAPATPANHLALAQVAVANGATSIVNANITDVRQQLRPVPAYLPEGFLYNGRLQVTVASNILTVKIVTESGGDPSATDPVAARIGGTVRYITSALSLSVSGAAFNANSTQLSGFAVPYWAYLGWRASTSSVFLGIARRPLGLLYSQFNTTVGSDLYMPITGAAAAGTDQVTVIDRFVATLTGTNWSVSGNASVYGRPVDFSDVMTAGTAFTGFSVNPTLGTHSYSIQGRSIHGLIRLSANGTSNATTFTMKVPITASASPAGNFGLGVGYQVTNNGVALTTNVSRGQIAAAGDDLAWFINSNGDAWTAANAKGIVLGQYTYQI